MAGTDALDLGRGIDRMADRRGYRAGGPGRCPRHQIASLPHVIDHALLVQWSAVEPSGAARRGCPRVSSRSSASGGR